MQEQNFSTIRCTECKETCVHFDDADKMKEWVVDHMKDCPTMQFIEILISVGIMADRCIFDTDLSTDLHRAKELEDAVTEATERVLEIINGQGNYADNTSRLVDISDYVSNLYGMATGKPLSADSPFRIRRKKEAELLQRVASGMSGICRFAEDSQNPRMPNEIIEQIVGILDKLHKEMCEFYGW